MLTVPARLTLVDQYDTVEIRPVRPSAADGVVCTSWDLGAPDVRSASTDRPGADGVIDQAGFTGSRTVTLDLVILGDRDHSPYAYVERLAAMTHPTRRPKLQIIRNSPEAYGQTWEMELRGNPYSIAYGRRAAALLEMQLSFTNPTGYLVGGNQGYESQPATPDSPTGYTFPITFPLATGRTAAAVPVLNVTVGGSAPISPFIYIYGPCVNPEVKTDDGERFKFANLTLTADQFVQVDMEAGTARIAGSADANVYHTVDFTVSTFWRWIPGLHTVRYVASGGRMAVQWRDRRLTI